jgi:hypothetical protein
MHVWFKRCAGWWTVRGWSFSSVIVVTYGTTRSKRRDVGGGGWGWRMWDVVRKCPLRVHVHVSELLIIYSCHIYKVVQIWPGQTVTYLHTNSPGHIWTTLYKEVLFPEALSGHARLRTCGQTHRFLGSFAKLRKATIRCIMSVCVHGTIRLPLDEFRWNLILQRFSKICQEISSFIKIRQE